MFYSCCKLYLTKHFLCIWSFIRCYILVTPTWYFCRKKISLLLIHLKLVSTESLLFSYSNTKVGFPMIKTCFVSFSVKVAMSITDEGPLNPDGQGSLTRVSIKLPTFWTNSPDVLFLQAKSQFAIKRMTTSLTKFHNCVAAQPRMLPLASYIWFIILQQIPMQPWEPALFKCIPCAISRGTRPSRVSMSSDQRPSKLLLPEDQKPSFFFLGLLMYSCRYLFPTPDRVDCWH